MLLLAKPFREKYRFFGKVARKNEFVGAEEKAQEAFLTAFVSAVEGATS